MVETNSNTVEIFTLFDGTSVIVSVTVVNKLKSRFVLEVLIISFSWQQYVAIFVPTLFSSVKIF